MERGRRRAKNVAKKWAEKKVFIGVDVSSRQHIKQKKNQLIGKGCSEDAAPTINTNVSY